MKLKSMYASVIKRPVSDNTFKTDDGKTKKLDKSNKKSSFKPTWQPLSKTAKPAKSPSKSPDFIEDLPRSRSPPSALADRSSKAKRNQKSKNQSPPPVINRRTSSDLPSPLKPVAAELPVSKPDESKRLSPEIFESNAAYFNKAASFFNDADDLTHIRYDQVASDEQENTSLRGSWPTHNLTGTTVSNFNSVALGKAIEVSSNCNQSNRKDIKKHDDSNKNDFEDLKNEMMKKYGFDGLNGKLTFDCKKTSLSTPVNTSSTSVHSDSHRPRPSTLGEHVTAPPLTKRAHSLTQPHKPVDWSDIPPIIPPREPVRNSRNSPPLRSSSTPSPTSFQAVVPTTTTSSGFLSVPNESGRSKYQVQSSTTAVFSAMPPALCGSNPVILPIMKDGRQESHTHYFLLGDDKSASKRQPKPESFNGIPRPTPSAYVAPFNRHSGPPPPRPPPPTNSVFNPLNNLSTQSSLFGKCNPASTYPPRRTVSSSHPEDACSFTSNVPMGRGEKVVKLQNEVFGVTYEECQRALRHFSWDVVKAMEYLKIEQLHQLGVASSKEECEQILVGFNWDLQTASQKLLEKHSRSNRT